MRRAGGHCSAFPTIVAVGERAALPHAPPTDRPIGDDMLVLVDWGANGPFYKSDLTRVLWTRNKVAFSGEQGPSPKLRAIYTVVAQAQRRAIQARR